MEQRWVVNRHKVVNKDRVVSRANHDRASNPHKDRVVSRANHDRASNPHKVSRANSRPRVVNDGRLNNRPGSQVAGRAVAVGVVAGQAEGPDGSC